MDTTPFDDLIAHWRSLPIAEGTKVPAKSALSPEALKSHLPNVGMFERIGRYDMQIRLFGTMLDEKFGQTLTGANLFSIIGEQYREFYADLYEAVMETPAGCKLTREALDANDYILRGESLILPLADEAGEARYTVGLLLIESESPLDDPIDPTRLQQSVITRAEFTDIGYGQPANPPKLPAEPSLTP